ncbi:acetate--CoA ligase family protein [Sulfitobacter sp. HNIBRBA3233]|uniref:acetate--CoA ligase family protein n=1 Tax=Sulfitobacter marinivivus TaxID=3158558 RepID=UPI0032DF9476
MARDLSRLFRPASVAVIGGGAWCSEIIRQTRLMGFAGRIDVVHPKMPVVEGVQAVAAVEDLDTPPDAAFVGVNRFATVDVVARLSRIGAGGAVCFASGFSEALAEDASGSDLQARLVEAAGAMPVLGPNCYGFINALDGALLWPDQHGCKPVSRGVAILTQSSNIAINLTMQRRGLPIAYVVACGNMAQTGQAEIATALLDDPRVTVIALHIEGFGDIAAWHALATKAAERGVPLVAVKVGRSDQARRAAVSHTASLAGQDAGAEALLKRLGIARVADLPTLLETAKLLHMVGPLSSPELSSISCSGGEASLAADAAVGRAVTFPALTDVQAGALRAALGPMVALGNPLDYHTYVWRNAAAMTEAWLPMAAPHIGLTLIIVDYPHTDPRDWTCATEAALAVAARSGRPVAMAATLPELMPPDVADRLIAGGVVPMQGLSETMAAAEAAASWRRPEEALPLPAGPDRTPVLLDEATAKSALAACGISIPKGSVAPEAAGLARVAGTLRPPLALKRLGLAHKSEAGAVRLGLEPADLLGAASAMGDGPYLVEEMVGGTVAELLVGVVRDPAHGFLLTVGAGGTRTELWQDTQTLLIPADRRAVEAALRRLRIWPLIEGYRGAPGADLAAICDTVMAVQSYVTAHASRVEEIEINPLMCTPMGAVAVDALIKQDTGDPL